MVQKNVQSYVRLHAGHDPVKSKYRQKFRNGLLSIVNVYIVVDQKLFNNIFLLTFSKIRVEVLMITALLISGVKQTTSKHYK